MEGLDWGSYYFVETKAPQGYSVSQTPARFSVNAENCSITQKLVFYDPANEVQVKINKEINDSYAEFGSPTFLFRIYGTDLNGVEREWRKSLTVDESGSGSTILSEIPAGTYTVEEIGVSRYTEQEVIAGANAAVDESDTRRAVVDLTTETEAEVTFKNAMEQYEKLSHVTGAANIIAAKRQMTGLTVEYTGPAVIESLTESSYTFTKDDLKAYAHYDDGESVEISFEKLELDPKKVTGSMNSSGSGHTVTVSYTEDGVTVSDSFSVEISLQAPAEPHTVTYRANGGYFGSTDTTSNEVTYQWMESGTYVTSVLKTTNITEEGKNYSLNDDDYDTSSDLEPDQTLTVDGAEELTVDLTTWTNGGTRTDGIAPDAVWVYDGDGNLLPP